MVAPQATVVGSIRGSGSEVYHQNGGTAGCDGLDRLCAFQQGAPSDSNGDGMLDTVGVYSDADWQVIEQRGSNDIKIQYVWSMAYIDAMVLRDRDSDGNSATGNLGESGSGLEERIYSQNDANYNTTSLLNDSGQVMERLKYDPYGAPTYMNSNFGTQSDQWSWLYLHQGGRLEWVSGTLNFRNRDYSPTLGRWIEQDPAGYVDGQNLYAAELSNPVNGTDSAGLFVTTVHTKITRQSGEGTIRKERLDRIVRKNWSTDLFDHFFQPSFHAQGGDWSEYADRLKIIKTRKYSESRKEQDVDDITAAMGRNAHTLQDFYSHTDWVEGNRQEMLDLYSFRHYDGSNRSKDNLRLESQNHPPMGSSTFPIEAPLDAGSEVRHRTIYTGGTYGFLGANDKHERFSADERNGGRDGTPPKGIPGAFNRAVQGATAETELFFQWAHDNMDPCYAKMIFKQ